MAVEYNKHHCMSPKFKYRNPVGKMFRQHPFLVNSVEVDPHADYHATNPHPLLLSRDQMLGCLTMMQEIDETLPPHERIAELAIYLAGQSDREKRVADNLFIQAGFVEQYGEV